MDKLQRLLLPWNRFVHRTEFLLCPHLASKSTKLVKQIPLKSSEVTSIVCCMPSTDDFDLIALVIPCVLKIQMEKYIKQVEF